MRCRAGEGHIRNCVLICQPLGRPYPSRRQRRRQHRGCGREVGGRHRTEHRERDQKPHPVQHRAGWRSRTSPSKAGAFQKVAVGYDLLGSRFVVRRIIAARPLAAGSWSSREALLRVWNLQSTQLPSQATTCRAGRSSTPSTARACAGSCATCRIPGTGPPAPHTRCGWSCRRFVDSDCRCFSCAIPPFASPEPEVPHKKGA